MFFFLASWSYFADRYISFVQIESLQHFFGINLYILCLCCSAYCFIEMITKRYFVVQLLLSINGKLIASNYCLFTSEKSKSTERKTNRLGKRQISASRNGATKLSNWPSGSELINQSANLFGFVCSPNENVLLVFHQAFQSPSKEKLIGEEK